tara:strand:- start:558 stop:1061 length:504 start_codon:yes stop_codon:yes gene_type:complete
MIYKKLFKIAFLFTLFASLSFSENYKVEVGVESITEIENGKYNISVYIVNPYDPIAGIQFKIIPSTIFNVEEVSGGSSENAGFQIHKNFKGTILGFSMTGNTIPPSRTNSGPGRLKDNIVLNIIATADKIPVNVMLDMECVMASKKGESLKTEFIPFDLSNINIGKE